MTEQKNKHFLGWIALDIDGTITLDKHSVPDPVVAFLRNCVQNGWRIAIATGRPLSFALKGLVKFDFPYLILAQNGSVAIDVPSKKEILKRYMPISCIKEIEKAYSGVPSDFVVFSGYENLDQLYWRPHRLNQKQRSYVESFAKIQCVNPIAVSSFEEISISKTPIVKCFGSQSEMRFVSNRLLKESDHFNITIIREPYEEGLFLMLISDHLSSKGLSLEEAIKSYGQRGIVIAAGDDENDLSLLEIADIKIAMAHAPHSLASKAHIIAPPTTEYGIIQALKEAFFKM